MPKKQSTAHLPKIKLKIQKIAFTKFHKHVSLKLAKVKQKN